MSFQRTMRALSDPVRRQILELLKNERMPAGEISKKFDITDAAISRHLSVLREADLVRDERVGKHIYYEFNASVLEEVMIWISSLKGEGGNDE